MPVLATLDNRMPTINDPQLEAEGTCLWLVWEGAQDDLVEQVFEEYGGVLVVSESNQALWFFFASNACLAAARLKSWSRFNQIAMVIQLFSAKLQVGRGGEKHLTYEEGIRSQAIEAIPQSQIWIHPGATKSVTSVLGLSLQEAPLLNGMSGDDWKLLHADTRLPYQANLGWYVVLRPVGQTSDKKLILGWREFFTQVEAILQRGKIRYNTNNSFLMFPLESVRQLKSWCKDYLTLVTRLQTETPERYWPCVSAIVERKGLNFNDELPDRVGVDWRQLTPDYPHMSKQSALFLGNNFSFHEDRFAPIHHAPSDWCSVSIDSDGTADANLLPNLVPLSSMGGYPYCFYCGQRSHDPAHCPTRLIAARDNETWHQMSFLDFTAMREAMKVADETIKNLEASEIVGMMHDPTPISYITKAIYDIGWPAQIRSISFFWLAKDKDLDRPVQSTKKEMASLAWASLEAFTQNTPEVLEKDLNSLAARAPRDFRIACLRGFTAMEQGQWTKAINYWLEAEKNSPYPVVASWHMFLQARAYECQNDLDKAQELYDQLVRNCPTWTFALYRKMVCDVKRGFTGTALTNLNKIIQRDGNFFNKILIDPELERGHIQIFSHLVGLWRVMEERAKDETSKLRDLQRDLSSWFENDHPFAVKTAERISMLLQMGKVKNFVTLQSMATGRGDIERDLQDFVVAEAASMKHEFHGFQERLEAIRSQAAWFPFPRILTEFNKVFNECVAGVNWLFRANLGDPDSFKKAALMLPLEKEKIEYLEGRMRTLCIIRDSTLFVLVLVETFLWIELIGIILIFAVLPLVLFYGGNIGMDWTASIIASNQDQVQKVLFVLLSVLAIGIAGMRTVLRFEKIREKVLIKAKEKPAKASKKAAKAPKKAPPAKATKGK